MRTTPLILTLFLGACGRPVETGDTDCVDCTDTDTAVDTSDTGCDTGCVDPNDPDGDGITQDDGDCAPTDATVYPGAPELLDTIDNDCDATVDEGTVAYDDDNDGKSEQEGDCDDDQPAISPSATDQVGDGIDQNCDDVDGFDGDGDGHASLLSGGDDCDDTNLYTFPGAIEIWYDGKAQGCQVGPTVEWDDGDQDGDLYPSTFVGGRDCDDTDATINPLEIETNGNGVDENCNGITDGTAFVMTWTPSTDPNPTTPVLDVTLTDSVQWANTRLYIHDTFDRSASLALYPNSALAPDLTTLQGDSNSGSIPFTGPAANMTFMLSFSNEGCFAWGYDTSVFGSANCVEVDPTTW